MIDVSRCTERLGNAYDSIQDTEIVVQRDLEMHTTRFKIQRYRETSIQDTERFEIRVTESTSRDRCTERLGNPIQDTERFEIRVTESRHRRFKIQRDSSIGGVAT